MFSLFKKTSAPLLDFGFLGVDMHSHILPGIDDGAPDLFTSIALIKAMKAMGYRSLIATPHVMTDLYPNTRDIILAKRDEVRIAVEKAGIEIHIDAAAEYLVDDSFEALYKKEPLLTLPGGYVLVEMSFHFAHPNFHKIIFDLQMKGYKPILAHPERYRYFHHTEDLDEIKNYGCLLQLNLLSINGYYGKPMRDQAQRLLGKGMVDFMGTDLHHMRHAELLADSLMEHSLQQLPSFPFVNGSLDPIS